MKFSYLKYSFLFYIILMMVTCSNPKGTIIIVSEQKHPREIYGIERLSAQLKSEGYEVEISGDDININHPKIWLQYLFKDSMMNDANHKNIASSISDEGFIIQKKEDDIYISANGYSGLLYGCLELSDKIKEEKALPESINIVDQPEMVLRGTCIGLQKTEYLPGRHVYEYPYTPENFPWFYDKELWIKYLDMMVENRYNSLYLWNGHPFSSLVKLEDYPYAVEADDETFKMNEEIFAFLTEEANKRGIWVIQMFYNIIISKPFAEKHGLKTQDRSRPIIPVIADYTHKSIAAFIEKYPNVGLLVTLGEAMNTIDDDVEWFTKTILPGVQDGLDALGITDEPPIVLRGHDTDAKKVMEASLPIYKNLYTMYKYNGESLATYELRESWVNIPKALSELGSVHISNVHILANLEPFRYGSPDFIQKSVQAMHRDQGANGLHLYPQASYWGWPYSADKTEKRLLEMDRDWIWYSAWARYAWNPDRDRSEEINFWTDKLGSFYDCGTKGAEIKTAYDEIGEIAPKLLRNFGISDGNRQTLLLGMFMGQLVNPHKYNVYAYFWPASGPEKEVLIDYAKKEWEGKPHSGDTPPKIIQQVVDHGAKAVEAIEKAESSVKKNKEEFSRLKNDVYCYNAFANFFAEKVKAAMLVLRYKYSNDINDLEQAIPYLEKSVKYYQQLANLTKDTYLYANSMQTQQRRIPISGADGKNKTWTELLVHYQTELDNFKRNVEMLKSKGDSDSVKKKRKILKPIDITILNDRVEWFPLKKGQLVYNDKKARIEGVAEQLQNLSGIRFSARDQEKNGTVLSFKTDKPVKILVGYFNSNSYSVLKPPTLETNAQANERGQADIKIANALLVPDLSPVNIYTYYYEPGQHQLVLGKGCVLILGVIDGNENIEVHDAGMTDSEDGPAVDWLFY